jgi:hypothetical protein
MQALYSVNKDQASELIKKFKMFSNNTGAEIVGSKEELENKLSDFKQENIEPIVIFNNVNNDVLFNSPVLDFKIKNMITCNSYKIDQDQIFNSIDFLSVDVVLKSISSIPNSDNLYDFYKQFSNNYSQILKNNNVVNTTLVVGVIAGTGIVVGCTVYYGSNKNDVPKKITT